MYIVFVVAFKRLSNKNHTKSTIQASAGSMILLICWTLNNFKFFGSIAKKNISQQHETFSRYLQISLDESSCLDLLRPSNCHQFHQLNWCKMFMTLVNILLWTYLFGKNTYFFLQIHNIHYLILLYLTWFYFYLGKLQPT